MGTVLLFSLPVFFVNLLHLYFMGQLLPSRLNWYRISLVSAGIAAVTMPRYLWGIFTGAARLYLLFLAVLVLLILPLFLFQGKLWKRLLLNFYFWGLQVLCDSLAYFTCLEQDASQYLAWDIRWRLVYIAVGLSSFALMGMLSVFIMKRLYMKQFHLFYLLFLVFPLSLWLLLFCYIYQLSSQVWTFGIALSITAQAMLLRMLISLEKKAALEQELKDVRHTMELEQLHYQAVEKRREELARIRHDFNNHLAAIGRLVAEGEEQDAQQMIRRLAEDISSTRENPYCGIPVINAVLQEKAQACDGKSIGLEVELDFPQELCVEPLHLCSIFSNLMDNAIRGAEESGESAPWIRLTSMVDGDYLFIKTVNSAAPPREAGPGRGYGLRILDSLARQYGGSWQSRYEKGIFTSVVSLLSVSEEGALPPSPLT